MCKLSLEAVRNNQSFSSNYGEPASYPLIQQWAVSWSDFFCFYHLSVICNIITSALSSFWILQDGEKWKIGTAPRPLVGGMEEERNLSERRKKSLRRELLKSQIWQKNVHQMEHKKSVVHQNLFCFILHLFLTEWIYRRDWVDRGGEYLSQTRNISLLLFGKLIRKSFFLVWVTELWTLFLDPLAQA